MADEWFVVLRQAGGDKWKVVASVWSQSADLAFEQMRALNRAPRRESRVIAHSRFAGWPSVGHVFTASQLERDQIPVIRPWFGRAMKARAKTTAKRIPPKPRPGTQLELF
jgi:hypothetical protein